TPLLLCECHGSIRLNQRKHPSGSAQGAGVRRCVLGVISHALVLKNQNARDPTSSSEGRHGQNKPPPQCRWGAFENPQFKWVPETLEVLETSSKEPKSVPYGFNVGSPKGSPRVEHGRGCAWITRQAYSIRAAFADQEKTVRSNTERRSSPPGLGSVSAFELG